MTLTAYNNEMYDYDDIHACNHKRQAPLAERSMFYTYVFSDLINLNDITARERATRYLILNLH